MFVWRWKYVGVVFFILFTTNKWVTVIHARVVKLVFRHVRGGAKIPVENARTTNQLMFYITCVRDILITSTIYRLYFFVKTGMAHCHNGGTIYRSTMKENVGICLNSDGPLPQRWLHLPRATHCEQSDTNHTWKHRNLLRRIACGELPVFRKKNKGQ